MTREVGVCGGNRHGRGLKAVVGAMVIHPHHL